MPMPGGGGGGGGGGAGSPGGSGPGGALSASPGAGGPEGGGVPGGGLSSGPPPGMGAEGGPGGGKGAEGDAGGAAGMAAAAIGGLALGGKGGDSGGGAPPMSTASYSMSMSKNVTNEGGDVNAGDLSQLSNRSTGDNALFNNLSNMAETATSQMGLPPMAGDAISSAAIAQAGNALFGSDVTGNALDNRALTSGLGIPGGPDGIMGGDMALPSAADRNPLAKDLSLDQMYATSSYRDVMSNGIDPNLAGHPQAELARAGTQNLMQQSGIGEDTLNRALQGDSSATKSIQDTLGVSPMTLDLARSGDPGAAALALEASARANGQPGALPPGDGQAARDQLLQSAALDNNPIHARELLSQNGEHTIAAMSASQAVKTELQQAGVSPEQFRQALSGDPNMQSMVSEKMGGVSFDKVQSAYYGDAGSAATTMVACGNNEIRGMQAMGMSPEQIQAETARTGDASVLAAQAAQGVPQGTFERALAGDTGAQRELQAAIGSSPAMLEAAYSGSTHARSVIESATGGQDATVMAAASHNTQAVLSQLTGDPRGVEQAINGSPQQREAFVQQYSSELGVSPRVLNDAIGGGSLAANTVMARAGQVAEAGQGAGSYQLSDDQNRLAAGLQSGSGIMVAAQATYQAASHGGQDVQTLQQAAGGSQSHALAVSGAVQSSQELRAIGSPEAASVLTSSSGVTYTASDAIQSYSVSNPTSALHDASVTAQTTLRDAGIDPQAVVSGVRSGDTSELTRAASTFGVSPDVVQGALMRGDSGDAITLVGAAGRHTLSQGAEAVQQASQTQSGQLALHVAQSVPQNVLSQAMAGNDVAQAHLARSVAADPQVLSNAAGNEVAMRAVGSTLGEGAYGAVAASSAAQEMVRMHPDQNLVQNALYGQGSEQHAALTHLARDMNVSPQVLSNSLSGSTQDLSSMVSASSAGLHRTQESGQAPSPYFSELSRAAVEQAPLAHAIHAAGYGQSYESATMAGQGVPGAQEAVRATMEVNPQLSRLMNEGNHSANAILTAASSVAHHSGHSGFGEAIRDSGAGMVMVAAAGNAIMSNLRPADPVHGVQPHHHYDRGAISGYEQFTARVADYSRSTDYARGPETPQGGGGSVRHQEHYPAHDYSRSADSSAGRGASPMPGPGGSSPSAGPSPSPGPSPTHSAPGSADIARGGMEGPGGMSPAVPPDSLSHQSIDPRGQYIAEQPRHESSATGGWFSEGKRSDAPSGPKIADATSGAAPSVIPSGGGAQNRSLTPQTWQGPGNRDRKAQDERMVRQRIAQLEEQARLAKEANNQAEYEAIKRNLEQYGRRLEE